MIYTRGFAFRWLTALAAGALLCGCAKKGPTMVEQPKPNPQPQLATDVHLRVRELGDRVNEFSALAGQLPGRTDADHRRLMQQAFDSLEQILPLLRGPERTNEFEQQLRIIRGSNSQLASASTELSVDPIVATGLLAVHKALANVATSLFSDQPAISQGLQAMQGHLDQLDTSSGAMHRVVASQVIGDVNDIVRQMSSALAGRVGSESAPTTAPTTQPDPGRAAFAQ